MMTQSSMHGRSLAAWCLGPAAILMIGVGGIPLLYIGYTSFGGTTPSADAYRRLFGSTLFLKTLWSTLRISLISTVVSLLLGYPVALHLSRLAPRRRAAMMAMVLLPFWTSVLVKSYAFTILLGRRGIINSVLSFLLGQKVELPMLFHGFAVIVGMANYLVPFAVFPILASLLAIDPALGKAAALMGAGPCRIFWEITLPLSMSGVIVAAFSIVIISLGFFVVPALLGGTGDIMLANLVDFYTRETLDWPMASAIGVSLTLLVGGTVALASRLRKVSST